MKYARVATEATMRRSRLHDKSQSLPEGTALTSPFCSFMTSLAFSINVGIGVIFSSRETTAAVASKSFRTASQNSGKAELVFNCACSSKTALHVSEGTQNKTDSMV
jgi:hypothetical protein